MNSEPSKPREEAADSDHTWLSARLNARVVVIEASPKEFDVYERFEVTAKSSKQSSARQ